MPKDYLEVLADLLFPAISVVVVLAIASSDPVAGLIVALLIAIAFLRGRRSNV